MWIGMLKVRLVVYINVDRGLRVNVDRGLRVRVFVFTDVDRDVKG
jgi:hypothetical protein